MTPAKAGTTLAEAGTPLAAAGMTLAKAGMTRARAGMTLAEVGMTAVTAALIRSRAKVSHPPGRPKVWKEIIALHLTGSDLALLPHYQPEG